MKNLKQNLVKAILCMGVVSVSLVACQSEVSDDTNVINLDQLDDVISDLDSAIVADDTTMAEPVDITEDVEVEEVVEMDAE